MPAITDSSTANRPNTGSTRTLRIIRPMNVATPTTSAEEQLAAHPLPEHPHDQAEHRPPVRAPRGREGVLGALRQGRPVLDQVEDPDRDDHVADDRAHHARDAR